MPIKTTHLFITTPDGYSLDTLLKQSDNSDFIVVFAHGMTVNKDETIFIKAEELLNAADISTLRFDFRAHGNSSGTPINDFTISKLLLDLETIISYTETLGYKKIGLAGASFGGGISALFAGKHPDKTGPLLLANPVLNFEQEFLFPTTPWTKLYFSNVKNDLNKQGYVEFQNINFKMGPQLFQEMCKFNPSKTLQNYNQQILIIHGSVDQKISYQNIQLTYQNLSTTNKEFITVAGGDHGFSIEPFCSEVANHIFEYFVKVR